MLVGASTGCRSLGHDPAVGFPVGVVNIMHGTGTYIDGAGRLVQVSTSAVLVHLISALITQVRHLLSDVYTPAWLQVPVLFSLSSALRGLTPRSHWPPSVSRGALDPCCPLHVHGKRPRLTSVISSPWASLP